MLRTLDSTQLHCSCLTVFAKCQRLHTCNRGDAVSRFIHFFTFRSGSFTLAPIRLMPSLLPHSPCLSLSVLLPPCLALAPFPSRSRSRSLSLSLSLSLSFSLQDRDWCNGLVLGSICRICGLPAVEHPASSSPAQGPFASACHPHWYGRTLGGFRLVGVGWDPTR